MKRLFVGLGVFILLAGQAEAITIGFSGVTGDCGSACQASAFQPGDAFAGEFTILGETVSSFFVSVAGLVLTATDPFFTKHAFTDGPKQWAAVTGTVPGGVMSIGLTSPWPDPRPEILFPAVAWDCHIWGFCGFQIKSGPNVEAIRTNIEDPAQAVAFVDFYAVRNNGDLELHPIPEPGTLVLLGIGFLALAGARRSHARWSR